MRRIAVILTLSLCCVEICSAREIPADTSTVAYVGRTKYIPGGGVRFDWSGTYFRTVFTGRRIAMRVSDTGANYFNVFVDDKLHKVVKTCGTDTLVELFTGDAGRHRLRVQKRTEGIEGITTLYAFDVDGSGCLSADTMRPKRHVEFIGNSITCAFGSEGLYRDEPYCPETENCDVGYACVLARYFDADYTLIAHSGHGAARNYGDPRSTSDCTMRHRMLRTMDTDSLAMWDFERYTPDLVVVNLGSNDFSTRPQPSEEEFSESYRAILRQLRERYGAQVAILCVTPRIGPPAQEYIVRVCTKMQDKRIFFQGSVHKTYNNTSDLGASWHPNASGHRKIASALAPHIATVMGWEMPDRPLK